MSSLSRLEAANIPVVTALSQTTPTQLVAAAGITEVYLSSKQEQVEIVIKQWQSGRSQLPPTWRSLHKVLRKMNLGYLSWQIENHLNCKIMLCLVLPTAKLASFSAHIAIQAIH